MKGKWTRKKNKYTPYKRTDSLSYNPCWNATLYLRMLKKGVT